MQTKWIEPSKLYATRMAKAEERKAVNSARVISPDAIANSRWRTFPSPLASVHIDRDKQSILMWLKATMWLKAVRGII